MKPECVAEHPSKPLTHSSHLNAGRAPCPFRPSPPARFALRDSQARTKSTTTQLRLQAPSTLIQNEPDSSESQLVQIMQYKGPRDWLPAAGAVHAGQHLPFVEPARGPGHVEGAPSLCEMILFPLESNVGSQRTRLKQMALKIPILPAKPLSNR